MLKVLVTKLVFICQTLCALLLLFDGSHLHLTCTVRSWFPLFLGVSRALLEPFLCYFLFLFLLVSVYYKLFSCVVLRFSLFVLRVLLWFGVSAFLLGFEDKVCLLFFICLFVYYYYFVDFGLP